MIGYFVVRDHAYHWLVKYSRFGCNSEIIATFITATAARAYVRRMNKES